MTDSLDGMHGDNFPLKKRGGSVAEFDSEYVRSLSEAVYKIGLGERDTASMIAKDGDNGEKLRERSQCYDGLTRDYLRALKQVSGS